MSELSEEQKRLYKSMAETLSGSRSAGIYGGGGEDIGEGRPTARGARTGLGTADHPVADARTG